MCVHLALRQEDLVREFTITREGISDEDFY